MVMRLVPQEELLDEDEIQALEDQALQAEARRSSEAEEAADEASDGAVEDAVEDSNGDGAAVAPASVDLALMEALLLSTHHPLTAGRLAELLDVETTKPVRAAIRQLNEQ